MKLFIAILTLLATTSVSKIVSAIDMAVVSGVPQTTELPAQTLKDCASKASGKVGAERKQFMVACLSNGSMSAHEAGEEDVCVLQRDQADLMDCLNKTEAALKTEYERVLNSLVAQDKTDTTDYAEARRLLAESQQSWAKYVNTYCAAEYKLFEMGADRDRVAIDCSLEQAKKRVEELKRWPD